MYVADCRNIQCPPDRPHKFQQNGQCFCTAAVPGGGVERLRRSNSHVFPNELGVSMLHTKKLNRSALGSLDSTAASVVQIALIGLAVYGGYTLFIKNK